MVCLKCFAVFRGSRNGNRLVLFSFWYLSVLSSHFTNPAASCKSTKDLNVSEKAYLC